MRIYQQPHSERPGEKEAIATSIGINKVFDRNYSLDEFTSAVTRGCGFLLDVCNGNRSQDNFVRTNYIGIDIDDEDANFYETEELLKENGYEGFYFRYKTFSYTEEHQKHRYILKFDEYLDVIEALRVYKHLSTFIRIDESTVNNIARIWFGTSFNIEEEDKPGFELSKAKIFDEVIPDSVQVRTFNTGDSERRFDFNILRIDEEEFKREIDAAVEEWDYTHIRQTIYSACLIVQVQMDNTLYLDYFKSKLDKKKLRKFERYIKSDLRHHKFYYGSAMRFLSTIAYVTPNKIENVFDIIDDIETKYLAGTQYIKPSDMKALERGTNLLVAPAGSGKTTAIIELAKQDKGTRRVLTVPTIAIAEQLELKYHYESGIEFLHSGKHMDGRDSDDLLSDEEDDDIYLTICTYDAYYVNTFANHILYIDEAHELVSFYGIKQKESIVHSILTEHPDNCIFVTATPFNLADDFQKKVMYTKPTNKDTDIVVTNNIRTSAFDIILDNTNRKYLVYINSKAKMKAFREYIAEEIPELRVATISSQERSDAYIKLMDRVDKEDFDYDIIITTKFLNIGFDINYLFDDIIYADDKIRANDLLQIYNRERQNAKVHIITKNELSSNGYSTNSRFKSYRSKINSRMTVNDKYMLDSKHVDGELNPHIVTDQEFYSRVLLTVQHIEQLFEIFYPNFDSNCIRVENKSRYVESKTKTLKEFIEYFNRKDDNGNLKCENDLVKFITGTGSISWVKEINEETGDKVYFGSSTIKAVYRCFRILKTAFEDDDLDLENTWLWKNGYLSGSIDDDVLYLTKDAEDYLYLSDYNLIERFDEEKLKSIMYDIHAQEVLYDEDRDRYINMLNMRGYYIDNKPWNVTNFNKRLQRFGLHYKPKQLRVFDKDGYQVMENGKPARTRILVRVTVMVGE